MKLKNNFPDRVRFLYLGWWECFMCRGNGQDCGGLEIHHIMGRISDVAFNSSCLCKRCHAQIKHTQKEEQVIFLKTIQWLFMKKYEPSPEDLAFFKQNEQRLSSPALLQWLNGYTYGTDTFEKKQHVDFDGSW